MTTPVDHIPETERFMSAVLSDAALQSRLGALTDSATFALDLRRIADELGFDPAVSLPIDPGPDPLGISRFQPAPVTLDAWPPPGWLPVNAVPTHDMPALDWAWFGERALREPLYEDTARRMAALPLSRAFRTRTGLDALIAGAAAEDTLEPDGFIFHMSRCGSTLVAQMLAAVPANVVASEPAPLESVVHWAVTSEASFDQQVAALRSVVAALGRRRLPMMRRFFLKLEAWNIVALPLFRAAFPNTPWIFLYRRPEEVMVSHIGMAGIHFAMGDVPGMPPLALPPGASLEDQGAAVLARYLQAAIRHAAVGGGLLVNYTDLNEAMRLAIPRHFGFTPTAQEQEVVAAAAQRNAKAPDQAYADDTESKRERTTPAIRAAVERHLRDLYAQLEILRVGQSERSDPYIR